MGKLIYHGPITPTVKKLLTEYNDSKRWNNRLRFEIDGVPNTQATEIVLEQIGRSLRAQASQDYMAVLLQELQRKHKVNPKSPEFLALMKRIYDTGHIKGKLLVSDPTAIANEFARVFKIPLTDAERMRELREMLTQYKKLIKEQKEVKKAMEGKSQIAIRDGQIVLYDKESKSGRFVTWLSHFTRRPKADIPEK